ncbi:flagellar filament capping protein FliD [Cellulomonas bogoriensis]|uniref:Flagellar hook-associated protein 2 n=1 Tax=Cellulomonas bogoriensis 69B4 = DSM 16987 TaxID=1386082 RepID=A0A0A0BQL2_9CELL|nr:flagellar filament capping protein FliD [Cellulomonas bogoriensis]KGM10241.1 hypothetical protein N869_12160 [Cellulomonas bogoriensis 69B4 = DSM 16987]
MGMFGIDGLASGLNTSSMINQLMQVEAMPQTLLKQRQSTQQSFVSALQGLNTRVASLAEAATKAAKPASWQAYTATASDTSATVTTHGNAQPGSLSFSVDAVAQSQMSVSAKVPDDGSLLTGEPPALTVRTADGQFVTVSPTTGSLNDIAKAINNSPETGVRATVVRVSGTEAGAEPEFRLQFTGSSTGTTGAFGVYAGTSDQLEGLDPAALATHRIDGNQVRAATDAVVTLWKGVDGLEEQFVQSSNTFTNLMTGVDVTVNAVTAPSDPPVTVTVARDDEALTSMVSGVVGALGVVLSDIASRSATTTTSNANGGSTVTGGVFTGDSTVRNIQSRLASAMSMPVGGESPSAVGIMIGRDGTITFDKEVFGAAMAADPARTQAMVTEMAQRVADVASGFSDKYDGTLTRRIESQQGQIRSMTDQIEGWDRRLELRRANLQRTYAALEVTLSNLSSQSNWLAGQLGSLPSYNNS